MKSNGTNFDYFYTSGAKALMGVSLADLKETRNRAATLIRCLDSLICMKKAELSDSTASKINQELNKGEQL